MNLMKRYSLFLVLILIACTPSTEQKEPALLLISFDGFRADYLSKAETPNFDKLVKQGVTSEGMIPVFPTKTFPNHYAMVTGLYPENNGLVGNNMYDPVMDEYYSIGNRDAVENPEWYEGEPIWNTAEKQGKKAGTMFWVGSEAPIQDMRPTYWKRYDGDMPNEARIDSVIKWMSYPEEKRIDLGTLYFSFVDDAGHYYGPDSPEIVAAIQKADSLVGYLMDKLAGEGLAGNVNVLIVSDHGMIGLSPERLVLLDELISLDDVDIITYTPVIGINPAEGKTREVYQDLKQKEEYYTVYLREELPERYGLKNHRRTPEILLVADPGWTIAEQAYVNSRSGEYPTGGTHGFDNLDPRMHALFVGYGPNFKEGYKTGTFANIHLYELMSFLLGVEPSPNDGNLEEVSDMLR